MRKNTSTYGTKGHKENTKNEKHEIALTAVIGHLFIPVLCREYGLALRN